jgi:serine protease Do
LNSKKIKGLNSQNQLIVTIILAFIFGLLGSLLGTFLLRKMPATTIQQSKQVVIDQQTAVANVAKKVSPSVVSIVSSSSTVDPYTGQASMMKDGAGTGIIMTKEGLIMTNKHVVEGGQSFNVYTNDNTEYKNAKVVATDPNNDIAFLKIEAKNLAPAELGDSDKVEVGQSVVAIGNALGQFQNTVTTGVISGKSRPITANGSNGSSEALTNLFQTDAAINPGNSGGPLVDIEGRVIGINTAVAGNAENIGFAIPINDAKNVLNSVIKTGKIVRPYIGVRYITLNEEIAKANELGSSTGALVYGSGNQLAVLPGSPAAKAGIQEGDIILKIDGNEITESSPISSVIGKKKPGNKVEIIYLRDGKQSKATVTLAEAPSN